MPDKSLYDMTQDEALEYLRGLEGIQNIGTIQQTGGTNEYDPIFYTDAAGKEIRGGDGEYYRNVTPMFDPNYGGGVYGYYKGIYDKDGNLKDVKFEKGERHEGFFSENLETIGPLVVAGAMGLGGGLFGGMGGPGTGAGALAGEMGGTVMATEGGLSALNSAAAYDAALTGVGSNVGTGTITGTGLGALDAAAAYDAGLTGVGSNVGVAGAETAAGLPALETVQYNVVPTETESVINLSDTAAPSTSTAPQGAGATGMDFGAGAEAGFTEAGAAAPAKLSTLDSAKEFLKTLGIKDLKTALQMGLLGAGLVQMLGAKSGTGGGAGASGMQLRTPMTYSRTRNPQAKYATAADARAYMQGQPGTSSGQQRYFNQGFTKGDMYDARTGETYVKDPNTGRLISKTALDEASRQAGLASGGLAALAAGGGVDGHLGSYSDGGRLLRGPGDGVSDSIPATIGGSQPARLADGEFVVPARIVSELGNGSTEAGARKLYQMMDRIQRGRRKTVGKNAVAKDSKAEKHLPA
jgi:hypothetical protein